MASYAISRHLSLTLSPTDGNLTPSLLTLRGSIGPVGDLASTESRRYALVLADGVGVEEEGLAVLVLEAFAAEVLTFTEVFWEAGHVTDIGLVRQQKIR